MSKNNRLNWADLGLTLNESEFTLPDPSDSILTNVPPGNGTDSALSVIDGGSDSPGLDWNPEMQDQPKDAPGDRSAADLKMGGEGIKAKTGGGQQSSDQAADAGEQASDNEMAPPFKKQDEGFKLNWADLGLMEDDTNPFKGGDDDGEQSGGQQSGGQQSGGQQSGGQQSGQQGGQQSGGQQSGKQSGQQGGQQSGGQQAGSNEGGDQSSGGEARLMDHNMGGGEIAVDQDLMKDIIRAAVADQPDESQIDLIVQAISGCCGEDRTLGVADAEAIMGKLKELAGGQQGGQQAGQQGGQQMGQPGQQGGQQAPIGGQQGGQSDLAALDSTPPGDGDVAGAEGGQQHEGKTKLMSSLGEAAKPGKKKLTLAEAWIMAVPGVGVTACLGEAGGASDDEVDEDTVQLRRMARASGNPDWFNIGR